MGAVPGWSWQLTLRLTLEVLAKWGGWWCHTLLLNLHYQWHLNKVVLILLMAACMSCSHYEAVRVWDRLRGKSESWVNCLFLQHTLAKETRKRCMYKFCLWMPLNSKIFRCFGTVPGYTPFQPSGYSSEGLTVLICGMSEQRGFFGAVTLLSMPVCFQS